MNSSRGRHRPPHRFVTHQRGRPASTLTAKLPERSLTRTTPTGRDSAPVSTPPRLKGREQANTSCPGSDGAWAYVASL